MPEEAKRLNILIGLEIARARRREAILVEQNTDNDGVETKGNSGLS